MTKELACDAMQMAVDERTDFAGVIMHTDRGSQYCSKQFQAILKPNEIRSSMSKKIDSFASRYLWIFETLVCILTDMLPSIKIILRTSSISDFIILSNSRHQWFLPKNLQCPLDFWCLNRPISVDMQLPNFNFSPIRIIVPVRHLGKHLQQFEI